MKSLVSFIKESAGGCVVGFLDTADRYSFSDFQNDLYDLLKADGYIEGKDYDIEDDTSSTSSYDYDEGTCHAIYVRFYDPAITAELFANNPAYADEMDIEDCTDEY